MPEPTDVQRDLLMLEAELKKLEAEYNMFFAGRLPRPPWETRSRVDAIVKRWDRSHIQTSADRFRFNTLQTRFAKFCDLWDRGLRAREEGRAGPFSLPPKPKPEAPKPEQSKEEKKKDKAASPVVHVTSIADPSREIEKLHSLYDALMEARRSGGEDVVPFQKFSALVKDQVKKIRAGGHTEVAFRVAVKDGKIAFTARGIKKK